MSEQVKEKPGYKSTEFWLTVAVAIIGALMASGMFGEDHWAAKAIGLASSGLAALGYSSSRAKAKLGASLERASLGKSQEPMPAQD